MITLGLDETRASLSLSTWTGLEWSHFCTAKSKMCVPVSPLAAAGQGQAIGSGGVQRVAAPTHGRCPLLEPAEAPKPPAWGQRPTGAHSAQETVQHHHRLSPECQICRKNEASGRPGGRAAAGQRLSTAFLHQVTFNVTEHKLPQLTCAAEPLPRGCKCLAAAQVIEQVRQLLQEQAGGLVMIEGDAGLGKTRLLQELRGSDMAGLRGAAPQPDVLILSGGGNASRSTQVASNLPLQFQCIFSLGIIGISD